MIRGMERITANVANEKLVKEAKKHAFEKGISLRMWAGDVIEAELSKRREKLKKGPLLDNISQK